MSKLLLSKMNVVVGVRTIGVDLANGSMALEDLLLGNAVVKY